MSYRLLRLAFHYPAQLAQFYAERPGLESEPYAAQHAALMHHGFGQADFWSGALAARGYAADDLVANAEPMQRAWAAEHDVPWPESGWLLDVLTAQVQAFAPEVVLFTDYAVFDAAYVRRLRAACPSIRLVLGWCGAPYRDPAVFDTYDAVLSNVPELVADFRQQGHTCYHVNHAFDPRVLDRIDRDAAPSADFIFVGSIVRQGDFHTAREQLLLALVRRTGLRLYAPVRRLSRRERWAHAVRATAYRAVRRAGDLGVPPRLLARLPLAGRVARWPAPPSLPQSAVDARLERRVRPPLFGLAMYQRLHDSRVTLNTHIAISTHSASNMRLFEATGVGACLLTDWKPNLPDLFAPETEVVTYRSADECVEKARYLLDHEEERRAIAAAGQARTLRDHTTARLAAQLDQIIREQLSDR